MQAAEIGLRAGRARRLPRPRTLTALRFLAVVVTVLAAAAAAIAQHYRVVPPEDGLGPAIIREEAWPRPGSRVLVVAPHPDDETLGGEMVLRWCATHHIPASVVVVTCGDGFVRAAGVAFHRRARPADMIALGKIRQAESLHAMQTLGLRPGQVTFLGFPDGGLAALWSTYWDSSRPFRSLTTGVDHCPYRRVMSEGAPYSGEALLAEIERAIAAFRPTDIYVTHPWDYHPDHAATNYFVMAALHAVRSQSYAHSVRIHPYLVHCGAAFPSPRGYWPMLYIDPPFDLRNNGLTWSELRLTPGEAAYRLHIIDAYRTQVALTGPFLEAFARRNVLFGDAPAFQGRQAPWKSPAAARWSQRDSLYLRPKMNTRNAVVRESLAWVPGGMLVRVQATVTSKNTLCRVTLHPLFEAPRQDAHRPGTEARLGTYPRIVTTDGSRSASRGGVVRLDRGNVMTVLVPRRLFHGSDRAYLDITLVHGGHLVRSAPTRELVVPAAAAV